MKTVRFLGLDVHADTIAVAVAEMNGEVRSLGVIPNRLHVRDTRHRRVSVHRLFSDLHTLRIIESNEH